MKKFIVHRSLFANQCFTCLVSLLSRLLVIQRKPFYTQKTFGFTLIETLIAISVLVVAIAAPLTLAAQSLLTSFYAKDQVVAFHLAQEGIETVRNNRDHNLLTIVKTDSSQDWLASIPSVTGSPFIIDATDGSMTLCSGGVCPVLNFNGNLYSYTTGSGWEASRFTRSVTVDRVAGTNDEVVVSVTISWTTGSFTARSFSISENLFNWVPTNN